MKKVLNILSYPLLAILIILTAMEFIPAVGVFFTHLAIYRWLLIGVAAYIIITFIPAFSQNLDWMQTFSHERSHTVAAILMFHKIHDFRAGINEGVMFHSGRFGSTFITLAPYTMLLFTFPFLLFRVMGQNAFIYIVDMLIGFTLAFHVNCFWKQTRLYQTDIKNVGYAKSFMYIAVWHLFNGSLIILSVRKGIWGAIGYLFTNYWHDLLKLIPGV